MKHFLDLSDLTSEELRGLLRHAASLKADQQSGGTQHLLKGKTLAMIFEQQSTRTRVSFDIGMRQLGGYAMELDCQTSQLSRGESIADTARVMSRYVDIIMMRARKHSILLDLAVHATVPVINGLTDVSHPCQILADILTFEEHRGSITGKTLSWIGDGNNVATSFIHAAILLGFHLRLACPEGYGPSDDVMNWVKEHGDSEGSITLCEAPEDAVKDSHAVITDTWKSLADEESTKKKQALKSYQVNEALMDKAAADAIFMHCLPAYRGQEVTSDVIDSKRSVVLDEAENRLHVQKAVLLYCLEAA